MKRISLLIAAAAIVGFAGAASTAAFAGNAGDGSDYGTQPGYDGAIANSDGCAGAGAFGFFGTDWNLGIEDGHALIGSYPGPGTDGTQTGLNNSQNCGNRQGNLPD
jgi:hypothetical protein